MIGGIFHKGSGLGNQLHRYVMTRVLAEDCGVGFGMIGVENFKAASFLNLDMGHKTFFEYHTEEPSGRLVIDNPIPEFWNEGKYEYNPEIKLIKDHKIIDGEFQDERYFEHRLPEIREWLKTEPLDVAEDVCIVNFRGGEYVGVPDLFLGLEYWKDAIREMALKYPGIRFKCVTDDLLTAKHFFPMMPMSHEMSEDWRSIRYAKHLILSNSSFAILPALLNENVQEVFAPKFWAGHNIGEWRYPMNQYKKFTYL